MTSKTTSKPRVLVTSGAGHTGVPAVQHLLENGFPVRAFVRSDDQRAEALRRLGAEVFVGNLFDIRDLRRALDGVRRAYHCAPFGPNLLHGTVAFAVAAEEAGLEAVAWMGAWNRHQEHPSIHSREHWLLTRVLGWMPSVPSIHIEPGLFAFAYFMGLPFAKHLGMLALPFGDGANAPPSNEDIGRLAAQTLIEPDRHLGRTYRPTGPAVLSNQDCADALGRVFDRRVRYRAVTVDQFVKAALAMDYPWFEVSQIRHFARDVQRGVFEVGAPTDHVEAILGRPAEDFETIAHRYVGDPDRVVRGLRIGSKLGAFRLAMRMMLTRVPDFEAWERERGHPAIEGATPASDNPAWMRERSQLPGAAHSSGVTAAPVAHI